ncbi:hypothetical protein CS542_09880 [Pedobacter sp. IW39]|nr:hypothetical protein CS542_09880 [Pedobacter sp. IW39]
MPQWPKFKRKGKENACRTKAHEGAILAEVIHLPEARIGIYYSARSSGTMRFLFWEVFGSSGVSDSCDGPSVSVQNNSCTSRSRLNQLIIQD